MQSVAQHWNHDGIEVCDWIMKKEARKAPVGCLLVLLEWDLMWEWVEGRSGVHIGAECRAFTKAIQMGTAIQFTPTIQTGHGSSGGGSCGSYFSLLH